MAQPMGKPGSAQRFPLDQPDEVGPGGQEVEVIGDGAGQNGLGALVARERPGPAFAHGLPDLGERAVEHRLIEVGLGSEEVARSAAGDAGRGAHLIEAGGVVPLVGKEPLRGIEDRRSAPVRVPHSLWIGRQCPLAQRVAACLLISKLPANARDAVNPQARTGRPVFHARPPRS